MGEGEFVMKFSHSLTQAFGYLVAIGIPLLFGYIVKDFVSNIVGYFNIKSKSTFVLHNDFEYKGRKRCRVSNIDFTEVTIFDMDTGQTLRSFNKDFVKADIWENAFKNGKGKSS